MDRVSLKKRDSEPSSDVDASDAAASNGPGETEEGSPADSGTLLGISRALHAATLDPTHMPNLYKQGKLKFSDVFDDSEPVVPLMELGITKREYIKKQNEVFKQLAGHDSWSAMRSEQLEKDEQDSDLKELLELYIASLDERIYNEVGLQERLLSRAEAIARKHLSTILDIPTDAQKYAYIIKQVGRLEKKYTILEANYESVKADRDLLDSLRLELKHKYALELSKNTRLDHMVRVLSAKLLDVSGAHDLKPDNGASKDTSAHDQATPSPHQSDDKVTPSLTDVDLVRDFTEMTSLDEKLTFLYKEIIKLQKLDLSKEIPDTPEKIISKLILYIENARGRRNQQIKDLIKAFMEQYRAREQQLMDVVEKTHLESQIYLSRCDKLEKVSADQSVEIQGLIDRSVSLILTDKQLRSQLVTTSDMLRNYEVIMNNSRAHMEKLQTVNNDLLAENQRLHTVNTELLKRLNSSK